MEDWTPVQSNVPAELIATRGLTRFRNQQIETHTDWIVRLRYLTGIGPDHRVLWVDDTTDRLLFINGIVPGQAGTRRREMFIHCREVTLDETP